jgi:ABC-type multidrug transport system fused ATPase/permease subunit
LVQALFRLLEPEAGSIYVDGVDIATIGLHKLRKAISVIPQSPVLFTGCSVRDNLDPFGACTDNAIRTALEDVQMMSKINELPQGWNSSVSEGGGNFSVGERQLLCLARAILRKSSILVLDEATANIDSETEALLKDALHKSFGGATILMIAHRLQTVMDFDRILVLGDGVVLEYGSPRELLSPSFNNNKINNKSSSSNSSGTSSSSTSSSSTSDKKTGIFAAMVDHTGEEMARNLRAIANLEKSETTA